MLLDPEHLGARSARGRGAGAGRRRPRGKLLGRDARGCHRAEHEPSRDGGRGDHRARLTCARSWPATLGGSVSRPPRRACIRVSRPRRPRSRRPSATSSCTRRCGGSPAASRRSRCTCTSAYRTPSARCALLNGLRAHLPLLLALTANSPFWQGRATGLASRADPDLLRGLPPHRACRAPSTTIATGSPPSTCSCAAGAIPEPTFLWWDARPAAALRHRRGPRHGRPDRASRTPRRWCALVQSRASELEHEAGNRRLELVTPEALAENRFLAARDGMDAELDRPRPRPSRTGRRSACRAPRRGDAPCRRPGRSRRARPGARARIGPGSGPTGEAGRPRRRRRSRVRPRSALQPRAAPRRRHRSADRLRSGEARLVTVIEQSTAAPPYKPRNLGGP